MATIYLTDMGLSDAKFREIGRIIAYWSLLEFLMGAAVGIMRGVDRKEGRRLTLNKRVDDLTKMLVKASRVCKLSKQHSDRMDSLIDRIQNEAENRRAVAHGVWGIHGKKWSLLRFKKPDMVNLGQARQMTARDLQKTANRIATLTRDFERWLDTLPGR
jgi:hypothetical protein